MTRKLRPLTIERARELPSPCGTCAFWETAERHPMHCPDGDDDALLEAWYKTVRSEWGECGRVAYQDGDALGLVKYAPPRYFPQIRNFAAGPPSDDAVLLACMSVREEARHVGLGKVLLQAMLRDLVTRGEKCVEAYGTTGPADGMPVVTVNFLISQGFQVVRPHAQYPLLRLDLKTLAAWTDSVEALLDSLSVRLGIAKGVPAPYARSH
jgi:GNAT superfamily N-acetyltransferase